MSCLVLFSCPSPLLLLLRTHAPSQLPFPAGWGRPSNLLLTWSTCGDGLQPWRHGLQRSLVVASNLGVALSLMYCDDLQPGKNHHNQPHGSITTTSSPGHTSQLPNLQQPLARPTLSYHTSTRVGQAHPAASAPTLPQLSGAAPPAPPAPNQEPDATTIHTPSQPAHPPLKAPTPTPPSPGATFLQASGHSSQALSIHLKC